MFANPVHNSRRTLMDVESVLKNQQGDL